jgi:hypothetical protein
MRQKSSVLILPWKEKEYPKSVNISFIETDSMKLGAKEYNIYCVVVRNGKRISRKLLYNLPNLYKVWVTPSRKFTIRSNIENTQSKCYIIDLHKKISHPIPENLIIQRVMKISPQNDCFLLNATVESKGKYYGAYYLLNPKTKQLLEIKFTPQEYVQVVHMSEDGQQLYFQVSDSSNPNKGKVSRYVRNIIFSDDQMRLGEKIPIIENMKHSPDKILSRNLHIWKDVYRFGQSTTRIAPKSGKLFSLGGPLWKGKPTWAMPNYERVYFVENGKQKQGEIPVEVDGGVEQVIWSKDERYVHCLTPTYWIWLDTKTMKYERFERMAILQLLE